MTELTEESYYNDLQKWHDSVNEHKQLMKRSSAFTESELMSKSYGIEQALEGSYERGRVYGAIDVGNRILKASNEHPEWSKQDLINWIITNAK